MTNYRVYSIILFQFKHGSHKIYINKRIAFSLLLLILPSYAFTQLINIGVTKDMGWASWCYETIEFRDDCTIIKGYFVPSDNGCWVISNMDETLKAEGKEYCIIYTTLPTNRHPRTTYKGGFKVFFEEHYEPIFSTGGEIEHTAHNISFPVPFIDRKATIPFADLLPAYENHIDTLLSRGKYGIAAYLLNQYARKSWLVCTPEAKKNISKRVLSKYRVLDFFLNSQSDDLNILAQFENTYHCFDYKGDEEIIKKLVEINMLLSNIKLNINGNFPSKVLKWCETLIPMIKAFGKYNKKYEHALSLYRRALIMDGQTQRIPELDKEIIDVCSHVYNTKGEKYLEQLLNIASDLDIRPSKVSYDTYSGINLWKEVRDKAKLLFPNSWKYISALNAIASYNFHYKHYDVALMQYLSIFKIYKEKRNEWISEVWYNHDYLSTEQSILYVDMVIESISKAIGYCYYHMGDITQAIQYDNNNPYYHFALGDYDTLMTWCEDSYENSINGLRDIIKNPTIISPGSYYDEVFDVLYSPTLDTHIPYFAYKTGSLNLFEKAYNGSLITKGFRLTAGNLLRQYLLNTKDSISATYNALIDKEMQIYNSMIKTQNIGALDKRWEIVNLQRELISHLDSIGVLDTFFPKWIDIRNILKENELAIEFLEFPLWNQNQSFYVALTLRKDSEHPKLVPLFEGKQLKMVSDTLYYQSQEMTDLIWKPLLSELEGVNNIYFAPSGALHSIGIEYLVGMENYNIYRLSSTRELVSNHDAIVNKTAVLYGGLNYEAEIDSANIAKSVSAVNEIIRERANVRGMGLRGGKEYLEQTKIEVDKIGEELNKTNWVCLIDSASMGTEESFKSLSGKRISILHISTHGFYYTQEEADNMSYRFLQMDNVVATDEDKALIRSGLIMSGANHILDGETLPVNVEDGILTAKEIADVDLRGLDLVVLSACQTGLGDISQSEGVFGLQRGFKKAGANSILMSLWKVKDEATQILMTQFYKNLVAGQSKRQALRSAQKYLREYNNGHFNEPKYWAAFILLDARE